jgi:prophage regulatory protein
MHERITLPTILRMPDVEKRTGLRKSTIYKLMEARRFPPSIPIAGTKARGWDARAVAEWIAKSIASASASA